MIPSYEGGKFPLSTHLAAPRARHAGGARPLAATAAGGARLAACVSRSVSTLPAPGEVLIESFARARRHYLVAYPFEGRLAHQTLGMLLTRRLDRVRAPNRWALSPTTMRWRSGALGDVADLQRQGRLDLAALFAEDMLGDDLEAWLAESSLMRRTFRINAVIAGLIERASWRQDQERPPGHRFL